MSQTPNELLDAILKLSEPERLMIVERLMDDISEDAPGLSSDDPKFTDELRRRSGDWNHAKSWEQVREQLR
ncbi:hypothetical protein CA54_47440 [Symmachiella macrocystis]|uniref:Addiction module component n=1 Tax=Symmachiella macrocystis TaxID=2527985 RepID=A0A5C6BCR4_9PLAN|nr:hypothetical protein [Symmachiella macrocystis]TWU09502.1 hypothetical protein CA54_47440 [Symmachiella macrocystis]